MVMVTALASTGNNLKPSIISEGFEFIGEIRSSGYLTIDGTVRGTLALHSIQIGVTGVLDGNVTCDTMNVKGNFSGALDCRDLTIGSRAVVDGKVSFKSITIQRGGVVKGELKKKSLIVKTDRQVKRLSRQPFLFAFTSSLAPS